MDWSKVDDAPKFSDCVNGKTVEAKIISVYDGDTVKAIFPLNGVLYKWSCRLTGVDTPELRTRNAKEKKYGYFVRDELRKKVLGKVVRLECEDLDKYGRLLVKIFCYDDKCHIDEWLIDSGYAFYYDGGKKNSWAEFLENDDGI